MSDSNNKRWKAAIWYQFASGSECSLHHFEEISELEAIIEHGPDWNMLIRCTITLNASEPADVPVLDEATA